MMKIPCDLYAMRPATKLKSNCRNDMKGMMVTLGANSALGSLLGASAQSMYPSESCQEKHTTDILNKR